jgi:cytoskeletal protein RodZ
MSRTQRELKALRQQQREEAAARQRARDRRNLLITGGLLGAVALGILVVALYLNNQTQQASASHLKFQTVSGTIGTPVPDEGRNHVDPSATPTYQSYPPASGPHFSVSGFAPVAWQTVQPLQEGQYVHSLEHGGIAILYNCPSGADCTTLKNQLQNYVQNLVPAEPRFGEYKMVMTPYSKGMQKKVALVAWDYIEFLDGYDQDAITKFYENHVDQAPEQIA